MRALPVVLVDALVAGRLTGTPKASQVPVPPTGIHKGLGALPTFSVPRLIDDVRAGGEPVMAGTPKGTILIASLPVYPHYHPTPTAVPPTGPELLLPTQGQSYMWRSTDDGKTFTIVGPL